jgi:hypothetical protein
VKTRRNQFLSPWNFSYSYDHFHSVSKCMQYQL